MAPNILFELMLISARQSSSSWHILAPLCHSTKRNSFYICIISTVISCFIRTGTIASIIDVRDFSKFHPQGATAKQFSTQSFPCYSYITPLDGIDAMAWNRWWWSLRCITEALCMSLLRSFVLPFECHDVCDTNPRGIIVADPETNLDGHTLGATTSRTYINDWNQQMYQKVSCRRKCEVSSHRRINIWGRSKDTWEPRLYGGSTNTLDLPSQSYSHPYVHLQRYSQAESIDIRELCRHSSLVYNYLITPENQKLIYILDFLVLKKTSEN